MPDNFEKTRDFGLDELVPDGVSKSQNQNKKSNTTSKTVSSAKKKTSSAASNKKSNNNQKERKYIVKCEYCKKIVICIY